MRDFSGGKYKKKRMIFKADMSHPFLTVVVARILSYIFTRIVSVII